MPTEGRRPRLRARPSPRKFSTHRKGLSLYGHYARTASPCKLGTLLRSSTQGSRKGTVGGEAGAQEMRASALFSKTSAFTRCGGTRNQYLHSSVTSYVYTSSCMRKPCTGSHTRDHSRNVVTFGVWHASLALPSAVTWCQLAYIANSMSQRLLAAS